MAMYQIFRRQWPLLAALLFIASPGYTEDAPPAQDEILLKNGSRLIGRVTSSRDGTVTIDTEFAGTLQISMDQEKGHG